MKPSILYDNRISLDIKIEISSLSDYVSPQGIPGFSKKNVETMILLQEGEAALLTGIAQYKNFLSTEKVELLSELPVIGSLLKSKKFKDNESELWVMISAILGKNELKSNTKPKTILD